MFVLYIILLYCALDLGEKCCEQKWKNKIQTRMGLYIALLLPNGAARMYKCNVSVFLRKFSHFLLYFLRIDLMKFYKIYLTC